MPASELEQDIGCVVEDYDNECCHESLENVTPADVHFGRHKEVITRRHELKRKTLKHRKRENLKSQHVTHSFPTARCS
jgi:putative transposase